MKIEKDMYVRTSNDGIVKVLDTDEDGFKADNNSYYVFDSSCIIKASYNITDLIEVGDYVNSKYVDEVAYIEDEYYIKTKVSNTNNYDYLPAHLIKSIVTKEQFEQMSYKIEV